MRVLVTGATGWVGSATARELLAGGHEVLGVARTDEGAAKLAAAGIATHRGSLEDPASFAAGCEACDGVVHCAFIHDFSKFMENIEIERRAVEAMLAVLEGSGKPLVVSSGLAMLAPGRLATEADEGTSGRADTERRVRSAPGMRGTAIRLAPTVHGVGDHGFMPQLISIAREKGVAAYVGDGANRWPGVHVSDAARLYVAALERGVAGDTYHATEDEGVPFRAIAEVIGRRLGVPVVSIAPDEAMSHFGFLGMFAGMDMPTSSDRTRTALGWTPTGPRLLADLEEPAYYEGASKY
jgi:nucleoside-diphosphate-sugar epimerase